LKREKKERQEEKKKELENEQEMSCETFMFLLEAK